MSICENCHHEVNGNFCPNCGHPQKLERINGRYILSEIGNVLNLQKGIFYTIKELLIRPGQNIRQFISQDRNRLVKPILFILICSLTYTISVRLFHFEDGYIKYNFDDSSASTIGSIFQWISQNYGYSNILMAVFIALWLKMFFRKYNYNIYEILILLCFIMGMEMLIFSLLGILESLTQLRILDFSVNIVFIYAFWAIGQFFDGKKIKNYFKAFISYFLGMITSIIVVVCLALLIELIK